MCFLLDYTIKVHGDYCDCWTMDMYSVNKHLQMCVI